MVADLLQKFKAEPLNLTRFGHYIQWALHYFHDYDQVKNPELSITLAIDVSDLRQCYEKEFSNVRGASFTAYLSWKLIQAVKEHPEFNFRDVDGRWFEFKNPPVYFPVATLNHERLGDFYIENSFFLSWPEFCEEYRRGIEETRAGDRPKVGDLEWWWCNALFIGNLPGLPFTGFNFHTVPKNFTGRPKFYFGRRYQQDGRWYVPMNATIDHANTDPVLLEALIRSFTSIGCAGVHSSP